MHIFDRLKQMLHGLNSPDPQNAATATGTPNVTATTSDQAPMVNHTEALILVHHLDATGHELQAPDMIAGYVGDEIHLPAVNITGYHLVNINGLTRWFTKPQAQIVLTYERQAGQPVWAYAYDIDQRQLIGLPTMTRGPLGTAYQVMAPTVAGFKLLRSVGDLTGEYTTTSKTVLFFYRNQNWHQTDLSTGYVQIRQLTPVFPNPGATSTTYLTTLQPGSVYKTYLRVQLNDGDTWYNIGDNQWIPETQVQLTNGNQLLLKLPRGYRTRDAHQVQQTGIVSFVPGKQVHTYLEPYGRYLTTVTHGEKVILTERLVDDNRVVWYRIQNRGYLPGRYLTDLDPADSLF
ncbi:MucBP domain-containing protein [Lactiplantibacillus sp. WILCCON 0030]|uniref:MucBP domain-containing protein n=1 Tax=Lactiplantibacillus brownii TaxID=3069269 RepID=A0ABU1A979_9LACO|nr:MucBP domain-containing protein [Lactiplantibacillus brownii]MDQ7936997.1 MucBP domain-containing protein [Lactiplantibacillus brownii]